MAVTDVDRTADRSVARAIRAEGREAQSGPLDEVRAATAEGHPLGPHRAPRRRGLRPLSLASEESAFVTGAELVIDGDYTAR